MTCATVVPLKHDSATRIAGALARFQRSALSLVRVVGQKARWFGNTYRQYTRPAKARGYQARPKRYSPLGR